MALAFAAACGDGDDRGDPDVTPTSSATPTATVTIPPTPTTPIEPCEGAALTITARSLPGSRLDLGWTGLWRGVPATHDGTVSANLNCPDAMSCTIDGSDLAGRTLGAPLPISAGGVSVCVVSAFREAVTGTYSTCTGCGAVSVALSARVFAAPDPSVPSQGCVPAGDGIADLTVDLSPLTTATVEVAASVDCLADVPGSARCFCAGQVRPNACEPDGVCPASGVCELGPIDSVCDGQPFRSCRAGTGTEDCDARFPGAGSCVDQPRPCFPTHVARTGTCALEQGELVALFCVPATGSDMVDAMIGLPGLGAITLPISLVRTLR